MVGVLSRLTSWLVDGCLLAVCSRGLSSVYVHEESERASSSGLLLRALIPQEQGPALSFL